MDVQPLAPLARAVGQQAGFGEPGPRVIQAVKGLDRAAGSAHPTWAEQRPVRAARCSRRLAMPAGAAGKTGGALHAFIVHGPVATGTLLTKSLRHRLTPLGVS